MAFACYDFTLYITGCTWNQLDRGRDFLGALEKCDRTRHAMLMGCFTGIEDLALDDFFYV